MAIVGYARVSTHEQNLDVQLNVLKKEGCEIIFQEKKSGKNIEREELKRMLAYLRKGDVVVVYKLDRLGRSLRDILSLVERFIEQGIVLKSLTDNIDLGTAGGRFQLQVFAAFAELERNLIAERCTAGRIEAKRRGVKFGPKNQSAILAKAKEVERLYKLGLKIKEIQRIMGIKSNKTIYNYLNLVSKIDANN